MNKYLFFILFLFPVHLFAQEADTLIVEAEPHYDILQELRTESHNGGQVILDSDTPIDNLLQWHIHLNEKKKTFTGYRIQIHSDVYKRQDTIFSMVNRLAIASGFSLLGCVGPLSVTAFITFLRIVAASSIR